MFKAVAAQREVVFSWSPPPLDQLNGVVTDYTLSCHPAPSTLPLSVYSSQLKVAGFTPNITYLCSIVANNGLGSGPPANITFTTQQDCMFPKHVIVLKFQCSIFQIHTFKYV